MLQCGGDRTDPELQALDLRMVRALYTFKSYASGTHPLTQAIGTSQTAFDVCVVDDTVIAEACLYCNSMRGSLDAFVLTSAGSSVLFLESAKVLL